MSLTSVANPPHYDGAHFDREQDIPNLSEGDQYMETDTGDVMVYHKGKLQKMASSFGARSISDFLNMVPSTGDGTSSSVPQVLEKTKFVEMTVELAMFKAITQERYYQLKKLYASKDVDNRLMASNVVVELYREMVPL